MTETVVTLADRYEQRGGHVLLTPMQAFVRLPIDLARRDRVAGLRTAGHASGCRGPPITPLAAQDVHFEPGLNEEPAATSLRGTQRLDWFGLARVESVFATWYAAGAACWRWRTTITPPGRQPPRTSPSTG